MKNEIVLFQNQDVKLEVNTKDETVWLSLNQMSKLFDRDKSVISRHIKNVLERELDNSVFATTAKDGKIYQVDYYNLDMIISIGYRVKSQNVITFRRWANKILKEYLIKEYAVNQNRLDYLEKTVLKPKGTYSSNKIKYEDCIKIINKLKFNNNCKIFALERDNGLEAIIGDIYQTFDKNDVYPSIQEKADNFLYLITKNHTFIDGNKRLAATLFIFLKNFIIFYIKQKNKL